MSLLKKRSENLPTLRSNLSDFFNIDRFFDDDFLDFRRPRLDTSWMSKVPAANVIESDDEYCMELAVPGMNKKDFHIDIEESNLLISAEKEEKKSEKDEHFTRKEYSYNSFKRSFMLPDAVDPDAIKAEYKDGILKLTLPKKEEVKKKPVKEITIG